MSHITRRPIQYKDACPISINYTEKAACTRDYCIIFITGTKCMTVDVWKGTLKCTVSRAGHDKTCSLGGNGNWSVDSVEFV